jgi:translocation and assembly module TamB
MTAQGVEHRRSTLGRVARATATTIGLLIVFVLSLVGGVVLHLGTPPVRRAVVGHVNGLLAPTFKGSIRIDSLDGLGVWGLSGANVTISDPAGRPVIVARGVHARLATWTVIHSLLFEKHAPLDIRLSSVSIDSVEVRLDTDSDGNLELVDAFDSATPSPPTPPGPKPDPNARGLLLEFSHIAVKHVWAHGQMTGAPPIDADVDDLAAALTVAPDRLEGDVAKANIVARKIANGADVAGSLQAHAKLPAAPGANPTGGVAWRGVVGGIAHTIDASVTNDKVDVVVDVPRADPDQVRALWAASTLDAPADAHVEAHGPLSHVDISVHAGLVRATFAVKGIVVIADEKSAKLSLVARNIDLHELAPSVPPSRLGLTGDVNADMSPSGVLQGGAALHFEGGAIGADAIPAATLRAKGSRSKAGAIEGDLDLTVDEPGAPTHLTAHLTPEQVVTFLLDSNVAELDAVPELRHAAKGTVHLTGKGEVDIAPMTIDAELHAQASAITQGANRIDLVSLDATARGALTEPHLDAVVDARGLAAAGVRFVTARVHADGPPLDPHVDVTANGPDTPDIDASVDVGLTSGITLGDVRLALTRARDRAVISSKRVRVGGGNVEVDDAKISGLGSDVTAAVTMTPSVLHVRAASTGIDLARVARLARLEKKVQAGTLAMNVDLDVTRATATGHVVLSLAGAKIQSFNGVSARVDATLDGRKVAAKVHGEAAGVATIDIDAPKVELGGEGALSAKSWRGAWGSVAIDARADLSKLSRLIPPDQSPVNEASGTIAIHGHVQRDDLHDFTPDVSLELVTSDLSITPKTAQRKNHDGVLVMDPAPWTLAGLDFQIDTSIDGKTGALSFVGVVHDAKGEVADLHLDSAHVPYEAVFNDTGHLMDALHATAVDVHLVVPERDLASLPRILQQTYVTGAFKADVAAKGTLLAPSVDVAASLVKAKGQWVRSPITLDVGAHYDGAKGTATLKGASKGRSLLDAQATFEAAIAQVLAGNPDLPWTASTKAHLDGFPLQSITMLNDKVVSGLVSGDASLDDLHKDARAKAALTIASLAVGSVAYKGAKLDANADGKVLDATLRIDQTDGFVEAKAHAFATWGAAVSPTLDPAQPLTASLAAKNFRVVALQPFVDGIFDELDGRLDANANVALDPKVQGAQLSGNVALSRGTIEAVAGGGELHDIAGNLKFSPDGTITLEKLTGAGLTGKFNATGVAHVSGTTLQSAKVTLDIPHNAAIPVNAGGSEIGDVEGRIELSATGGANGALALQIGVPQLRVSLPEGSTTSAVSLGPMAKVSIGSHRGAPLTFIVIPIDPAAPPAAPADSSGGGPLVVQVNLGNVEVVRGTEIKIDLNGKLAVKSAATTEVTGQIQLQPGGTLTEQGKTFTVDHGTVTFVGSDPSNPEIVVQASWVAPEGTVVYANFVGPLKTGKVTLRSEPALPRDEIVQLLLFGAADGQSAQSAPDNGLQAQDTAFVAAGGEAAAPLNHALGQMGLGAVTTKIDTSQSNPKPEVEVAIANNLSLQIAVVLGIPPPGVNPDHTLVTLDWRFMSKWSLASTVGDAGTTIFDVLWKKRY